MLDEEQTDEEEANITEMQAEKDDLGRIPSAHFINELQAGYSPKRKADEAFGDARGLQVCIPSYSPTPCSPFTPRALRRRRHATQRRGL